MGNTDPWTSLVAQQPAPATTPPPQPVTPQQDPWLALSPAKEAPTDPWTSLVTPPATTQPKPEAPTFVGKAWDWLNEPITEMMGLPTSRAGAGPVETGAEKFASSFLSPASIALAVGTLGSGLAAKGLFQAGLMTATEALGAVKKVQLAVNIGFLAKYGYDLPKNAIPELEMNWGDYRAATNEKDKRKALDRLEELGTETVLGALTAGLATKGIASDLAEIHAASPKGRALLQRQYQDAVYKLSEKRRAASGEADRYEHEINKAVPSAARQATVIHNVEALGDPATLETRAVKASRPEHEAGRGNPLWQGAERKRTQAAPRFRKLCR